MLPTTFLYEPKFHHSTWRKPMHDIYMTYLWFLIFESISRSSSNSRVIKSLSRMLALALIRVLTRAIQKGCNLGVVSQQLKPHEIETRWKISFYWSLLRYLKVAFAYRWSFISEAVPCQEGLPRLRMPSAIFHCFVERGAGWPVRNSS